MYSWLGLPLWFPSAQVVWRPVFPSTARRRDALSSRQVSWQRKCFNFKPRVGWSCFPRLAFWFRLHDDATRWNVNETCLRTCSINASINSSVAFWNRIQYPISDRRISHKPNSRPSQLYFTCNFYSVIWSCNNNSWDIGEGRQTSDVPPWSDVLPEAIVGTAPLEHLLSSLSSPGQESQEPLLWICISPFEWRNPMDVPGMVGTGSCLLNSKITSRHPSAREIYLFVIRVISIRLLSRYWASTLFPTLGMPYVTNL